MATLGKPCTSLLSIPTEIRLEILKYVVHNPYRLTSPYHFDGEKLVAKSAFKNVYNTGAILRTCRQLYEEALPIFYGMNVFSYDTIDYNTGLSNCHLHLVKRIYLDCWTLNVENAGTGTATSIRYFDRLCPCLQALTLDISWYECMDWDRVRTVEGPDAFKPLTCALVEVATKARLSITFPEIEHTNGLPVICSYVGIGQPEDWKVSKTSPVLLYDYLPRGT